MITQSRDPPNPLAGAACISSRYVSINQCLSNIEDPVVVHAFGHFDGHIDCALLTARVDHALLNGYEGRELTHKPVLERGVLDLRLNLRVGLAGLDAVPVLSLKVLY